MSATATTDTIRWIWPTRDTGCPLCGGDLGPMQGELSPGVRRRRCTECAAPIMTVAIGRVYLDVDGEERVEPLD